MLLYKSWLDTQRWFMLGLLLLVAQVFALYMSYPMDPVTSYPNGALGVLSTEMARVRTGDFESYVWIRWFSTTLVLFWPVYAIAVAGTGFESPAGREYLLSLPFTRRRIVLTRLAAAAGQIVVFTILPTLLVCAVAPLVGQRYPVGDALVQCAILLIGGSSLFGLAVFLRVVMADAAAYTLIGGGVVLCAMFTFLAKGFTPYSIFRLLNGAEYFFNHHVPWVGLGLSIGLSALLIWASVVAIERRDY